MCRGGSGYAVLTTRHHDGYCLWPSEQGDWKLPEAERVSWTLYPFYHDYKDAPLMDSGLLGPVRLLSAELVSFNP